MDRLSRLEIEALTVDDDGLRDKTDQMHFDAAGGSVPSRVVGKAIQSEVAIQFAIDARKQIQVERSGDLLPIVVGGKQSSNVLCEVDAHDRGTLRTRVPANAPQKRRGLSVIEVADG